MSEVSQMDLRSVITGKHVVVRALDTPGEIKITRVVPGVVGRETSSIRRKQASIRLDHKRTLKELMYHGVPLVDPSDAVIIIHSGRDAQIATGHAFSLSLREIAAGAIRTGFGGGAGALILPGDPKLPPIPLKCPVWQCLYRVAVYYYDPDAPPPCAIHPESRMVPE